MGALTKTWFEQQSASDKQYILKALSKDSVRQHKNKRKGHVEDQVGHGAGGHYNSPLSPEKMQAAASQYIPGASGAFNAVHQVQNAFGQAQHYVGREGDNSYDGGAGSGFQRELSHFIKVGPENPLTLP